MHSVLFNLFNLYPSSPTLWSQGGKDWSAHRPSACPVSPAPVPGTSGGDIKLQKPYLLTAVKTKVKYLSASAYPRFGICSYNSCDGSHAVCLGNEAKSGDDSAFRERCSMGQYGTV
ncbi:hypothetical protein XENORESO_015918 [Xenotaenia resolanae]|uniref:Uncharacterized protein n=1 Tax=Xenotaenia resolanae TaxID=208358 RepID=A0ABV0X339_9TELE